MPKILIYLMLVYAALAAWIWWERQKYDKSAYQLKVELGILAPALLLHGAVILQPMLSEHVLIMGFGYATSLILWLMLMLYFVGCFFYRLQGLQLLLYPLAALAILVAIVFPGQHISYQLADWSFMLHIGASLLAYSLFGITTLIAVLILLLSRDLHQHKFSPLMSFLPPLLSLEKLMFQGMWVGFALLTISMISGVFFAEAIFGQPVALTHKTVFGVLSWFIYASLLLKHSMTAWRGRKVAVWTMIGFTSLMLAYVGSKFILEVILQR